MANWSTLKAAVAEVIKTNGNQEITGQILQNTLNSIISNLGENANFAGIATPTTNPGTPDGNVFYIAMEAGIYSNFNNQSLEDGLNLLIWNGNVWSKNNIIPILHKPGNNKIAVMSQQGVSSSLAIFDVSKAANKYDFATKADARIAAVQQFGAKIQRGNILQYYLSNGTFIQEMSVRDITTSSESGWLDVRFKTGKFVFRGYGLDTFFEPSINNEGGVLTFVCNGNLFYEIDKELYNVYVTDTWNLGSNWNSINNVFSYSITNSSNIIILKKHYDPEDNTTLLGWKLDIVSFNSDDFLIPTDDWIIVGSLLTNASEDAFYSLDFINSEISQFRNKEFDKYKNHTVTSYELNKLSIYNGNDVNPLVITRSTIDGKTYCHAKFNAGSNQVILLPIYACGKCKITVTAKASVASTVRIGVFASGEEKTYCQKFDLTQSFQTKQFLMSIPSSIYYHYDTLNEVGIGYLSDDNVGAEIDFIMTVETDMVLSEEIKSINKNANALQWNSDVYLGGIGAQNVSYTFLDEEILEIETPSSPETWFLTFNSTLNATDRIGQKAIMSLDARISEEGETQEFMFGNASSVNDSSHHTVILYDSWTHFDLICTNTADTWSANAFMLSSLESVGRHVQIKNLKVYVEGTLAYDVKMNEINDGGSNSSIPVSFNLDGVLNSMNKYSKYLTRLAMEGDSLIANAIGGNIPIELDEGITKRPIRMSVNNVPRRVYDYLSWNKPNWRRLDDLDWTNNGFTSFTEDGMFEGTTDSYWKAQSAGAYVEITIPDGMEHFALLCRTKNGYGTLNVTLNGGSVGTYVNPYYTSKVSTNSVVNSVVVPQNIERGPSQIDLNKGISSTGNPYHIVEFNNLPAGDNILRFTTVTDDRCDVWGGFYWTGNTLVVMNIAHGGHTTTDLINQHLEDELYNGEYDACIFEVTEINNLRLTLDQTENDLKAITARLKSLNLDFVWTSCNPLGLSIEHDTNFYTTYLSPSQEMVNERVRNVLFNLSVGFLDIFQYFKFDIINRGGTLLGGEGGLWYTWDGQHGNENGVKHWFDYIKKIFVGKPIRENG